MLLVLLLIRRTAFSWLKLQCDMLLPLGLILLDVELTGRHSLVEETSILFAEVKTVIRR